MFLVASLALSATINANVAVVEIKKDDVTVCKAQKILEDSDLISGIILPCHVKGQDAASNNYFVKIYPHIDGNTVTATAAYDFIGFSKIQHEIYQGKSHSLPLYTHYNNAAQVNLNESLSFALQVPNNSFMKKAGATYTDMAGQPVTEVTMSPYTIHFALLK